MKRIISCGEPLSPGLRQYLESTFETEVMNFYGASESLALGVEGQADKVSSEIKRLMSIILQKNGLENIKFTIRYATQIMPDINTGKKH